MSSRPLRVLRGAVAAGISVFTALFSHVALGGGEMPGWLGIAAPLVLALPLSVALVGRGPSALRVSLAVAASQALYHVLFVLGSPTASVAHSAHHHLGPASTDGLAAIAPGTAMWGAHVLAAAVTAALLFLAERGLELGVSAAGVLGAWVARLATVDDVVVAPTLPRLLAPTSLVVVVVAVPRSAISRRGPPLLPAF